MIQILEDNSPSSQRAAAISKLMGSVGGGAEKLHGLIGERKEREALAKKYGQEFKDVRNPEARNQLLRGAIEKENQKAKLTGEYAVDEENYDKIKEAFGERFAKVWRASPTGARTALTQAALEATSRGIDLNEMIGGNVGQQNDIDFQGPVESLERPTKQDYTKRPQGFTPKEWAATRKDWSKLNRENLDAVNNRIKANKRDILGTKKVIKLNESRKLPEGLERAIINPNTGEIYGLAQLAGKASPETQEFVKEIARFGNRAKDAYGSRVTNFDLAQYMKQFPGLLNTYEGRKRILRMMEINYDLDTLYDKTSQKLIDRYGAGNIPPEEVDRLSREKIRDEEERLFNEYLNLENENTESFMQEGMENSRPTLERFFE
jgi:hypothetical protein